jgi:hypothetical protein
MKIQIDDSGYVRDVRCERGHSGNTRYVSVFHGGEVYQCQGCGQFIGRAALEEELRARELDSETAGDA